MSVCVSYRGATENYRRIHPKNIGFGMVDPDSFYICKRRCMGLRVCGRVCSFVCV